MSSKTTIKDFKEISDLIKYSLEKKGREKYLKFHNISKTKQAEFLKFGFDVSDYNFTLTSSAINHALNKHGRYSVDFKAGKVPVCIFNIIYIKEILFNFDNLQQSNKQKNAFILHKKQLGQNINVVIEILRKSKKGKRILIKTMYIRSNKKKSFS